LSAESAFYHRLIFGTEINREAFERKRTVVHRAVARYSTILMLLTILTAGVVNVFEALLYQAKSDEQNTRAAARFGNEVGNSG